MNREEIILMLYKFFSNFIYHDLLIDEIADIIKRSGYEKKFFTTLKARLSFLKQHLEQAIVHKEFEDLKHYDLYSMHVTGKDFNIRILYSFTRDRRPVLLLAFFKRSGKKATDYTPYYEPAQLRLKEVLKQYE